MIIADCIRLLQSGYKIYSDVSGKNYRQINFQMTLLKVYVFLDIDLFCYTLQHTGLLMSRQDLGEIDYEQRSPAGTHMLLTPQRVKSVFTI